MGPANSAQVCRRMAGQLDKDVKYQNSTIAENLDDLLNKGFLETEERIEGELKIEVTYYKLTEKGLVYVRSVRMPI